MGFWDAVASAGPYANIHTHTRLTALCPGLPGSAGTRKAKTIWILLKQETVSGSGISWAICKSAPHSRQITTPAPHRSVFTGWMPFLPPNQQRQSTEGEQCNICKQSAENLSCSPNNEKQHKTSLITENYLCNLTDILSNSFSLPSVL